MKDEETFEASIELTKEYVAFMLRRISRQIQMGMKIEEFEKNVKDNLFEAQFDHFSFENNPKKINTLIKITIQRSNDEKKTSCS